MLDVLTGIMTFWVLPRSRRLKWRRRLVSFWHGLPVRRRAKSVGGGLTCHGPVKVTRHTVVGEGVSFNGARILGTGNVVFGDYVHSGEGLVIFTRNHNYDGGEAIPYDRTYTVKDVTIGDFVWIGAYVILFLKQGLPYIGFNANMQQIITGFVLIGAVTIDIVKRKVVK